MFQKRKTNAILYLNVDNMTKARADALAADEEAKFKSKMPELTLVVVQVRGQGTRLERIYMA